MIGRICITNTNICDIRHYVLRCEMEMIPVIFERLLKSLKIGLILINLYVALCAKVPSPKESSVNGADFHSR